MKILFVCSAARMRSFTARQIAIAGGLDAECAGSNTGSRLPINPHLVADADVIFCMEDSHKKTVKKMYAQSQYAQFLQRPLPPTHILNIPALFNPLDPHLAWCLIQGVSATHPHLAIAMLNGAKHLGIKPECDASKLLTAGW